MCNLSEGILERGIKQGADHVNDLNKKLAEDGRTDDIVRAAKEPDYQKQLFAEYGII